MSWSFASLKWLDVPILEALAAAAMTKYSEFRAQEVANTAWSIAKLALSNKPLLAALASAARAQKLSQWRSQELANTLWSFARLSVQNPPLMASLSEELLSRGAEIENRHAEMALVSLSTFEDLSATLNFLQALLESGRQISSLALAGPLSACERRGLKGTPVEQQLLSLLALCPDLGACAYAARSASLAETGNTIQANELSRFPQDFADLHALSRRMMTACGGERAHMDVKSTPLVRPGTRLAGSERPHEKETRLLANVLAAAEPGDAAGVYRAIEDFGHGSLSRQHGGTGGRAKNAGQWLKVAGGEKSDVLVMAARLAREKGLFLEVGTYCGYSALRLALATGMSTKIISLEADPAHAVIARSILAYAGLAHIVDVCIGHSEDWLPHLAKTRSKDAFGFVFFDQRGSRYLDDVKVLERLNALSDGAVIVADNVLKPGAPAFLWHVVFSGLYETQVISVREFSMPGVEDWMSVSIKRAKRRDEEGVSVAPPLPMELQEMEWEADQIRARAERSPGVTFETWIEFVARMRQCLVAHGISPRA